ncbi:hypothetical protein HYFRA_00001761 [Hymenoscyphus fraxineus]|uniref:Mid2 domain-containing protein n=1 Tax=Hymenoscyphus fraxineus TaxID=746836 RepID=A0A9N9KND1_9HELO|nr:hypothetical protein HYFRA_00001761 [Hymenoscyphus fraxineus]
MVSRSHLRLLSVLALLSIQTQATILDGANLFAIRQVASSGGTGGSQPEGTAPATNPPATSRAPAPPAATSRPPPSAPAAPTTERTNPPPPPATSRPPEPPTGPSQTTRAPNGAPTQPPVNTDTSDSDTPSSTDVPSSPSTTAPNGSSVPSRATLTSIDTATITPSVNILTIVQTISGSVMTTVSSSTDTSAYAAATSAAAANNAALANNDDDNDNTMPVKTRNIIIGVVVGVGGAIIFGGLFIVAWRIWGRKKGNDDSDGLMGFRSGSGNGTSEMAGTGAPAASPFQSTLENYHNPARGNVNASSNF